MSVNELQHMYHEKDPVYVIVELTWENWDDVIEWTGGVALGGDERGDPWIEIPNGELDTAVATIGDRIVKNAGLWQVWGPEDWDGLEPGGPGALRNAFVRVDVRGV